MAITIVAPPSNMLKAISRNVSHDYCELPGDVVIRLKQSAPIAELTKCTGDLRLRTSEASPIVIEPIIPPTEPREVIYVASSFE